MCSSLSGATYASTDSDFLVSDSLDFHPTDVLEDADGSLLVVDTGAWYKLCCPSSQLAKPDVLGAIYRVRRRGASPPPDPRGLALQWGAMTPAQLVPLLDDPRPACTDPRRSGARSSRIRRPRGAREGRWRRGLGRRTAQRRLGAHPHRWGGGTAGRAHGAER